MKKHAPPNAVTRARDLRRNATDAEKGIWALPKQHAPAAHIRRQVPIRHYMVDFASHRACVVVEIDGGQHTPHVDARRSAEIEAEGYRIVRFWNNEVMQNGDGCMLALLKFLAQEHPHPTAPRQQAAKAAYPSPIEGEEGRQ